MKFLATYVDTKYKNPIEEEIYADNVNEAAKLAEKQAPRGFVCVKVFQQLEGVY